MPVLADDDDDDDDDDRDPVACGTIPTDYVVYGARKFTIDKDVTVNGNDVNCGHRDRDCDDDHKGLEGDGTVVDANPALPGLVPASFPRNSSRTDLDLDGGSRSVVAGEYDDIDIGKNTSVSFTTENSIYHVDRLEVAKESSLQFAPGDYFIDEFRGGKDMQVTISPAGTVRLFIKDIIDLDKDTLVNDGGAVRNLLVLLYDDADAKIDKDSRFTGIIYAPDRGSRIDIDKDITVTGLLMTGGELTIDKDTRLILDPGDLVDPAPPSTCDEGGDEGPHHIEIIHDGSGITCSPETVTLRACADADCLATYNEPVSLALGPAGWSGGTTQTINGGTATLEFRHTVAGSVNLSAVATDPPAEAATQCAVAGGGDSCSVSFADAGLLLDVQNTPACTDQAVRLRAVRTDDSSQRCVPAFGDRDATLNFVTTRVDPASGSRLLSVNGSAVTTAGTDIPVHFDGNGEVSLAVRYEDAGLVRLDARFDGSGEEAGLVLTGGGQFASYPDRLYVFAPDVAATCGSADAACSVFARAGQSFDLVVRATCAPVGDPAGATVTPNFNLAGINLAAQLVAPAGGAAATPGVTDFALQAGDNGTVTLAQSVDEVGVFRFLATPPPYFGETVQAGLSEPVGRFIPAGFDVSLNAPLPGNSCTPAGADAFTYLGETPGFGYVAAPRLTIRPVNQAGGFTRNYGGTFWKLGTGTVLPGAGRTYQGDPGLPSLLTDSSTATLSLAEAHADFDDAPAVIAIDGDTFSYARPANPVNPFDAAFSLTIPASDLTDSDGVCHDPAGPTCNTGTGAGTASPVSVSIAGGARLRYGRGGAGDVYGTLGAGGDALRLVLQSLYWDDANPGSGRDGWQENIDDSCTQVAYAVSGALSTSATPGSPVLLLAGQRAITLTVTAPTGQGGRQVLTPTWPAWLPGREATATFGIFRGDDRFIHWSEQ